LLPDTARDLFSRMKHVFILVVFVACFGAVMVDGICTRSDDVCRAGSGVCLPALKLIFTNFTAAALITKYGKYCGATNNCRAVSQARYDKQKALPTFIKQNYCLKSSALSTTNPCPSKPCGRVDAACKRLRNCEAKFDPDMDVFFTRNATKEFVCTCYVDIVYDMSILARTTKPTRLCDAGFYHDPISPSLPVTGISLVKHEAVLLTGRNCFPILYLDRDKNGIQDCAEDTLFTNQTKYKAAYAWCKALDNEFATLGIKVCPEWHLYKR
jgi:hypothetical protein